MTIDFKYKYMKGMFKKKFILVRKRHFTNYSKIKGKENWKFYYSILLENTIFIETFTGQTNQQTNKQTNKQKTDK